MQVYAILPVDYVKLGARRVDWRSLKWQLLVASFVCGLIALMAVHYLWQRTAVERPLLQLLEQNPDVQDVTLTGDRRALHVEVTLRSTPRLASTVRRLDTLIKETHPHAIRVIYKDHSNELLEDVFHDMHFAIYQAARSGNYRDMANLVHTLARSANLSDYRVEVDATAIYLQLHTEGAYLYRIIPLNAR